MTDASEALLATTAASWGLPLGQVQLAQFARYRDELEIWNERFNLTAVSGREAIAVRHFLDSLALARHWGATPDSLIDIGSGAGFPGLPLKILRPEIELTLVESVGKKATFLSHIVDRLGLTGVRVLSERVELIGQLPAERERHAVVTARAVADLRVLVEYALPLLRVGGRLLAPKGPDPSAEIAAAERAIAALGGELSALLPIDLPASEPRSLVVITKRAPSPARFPRAVGLPSRRPL